jgi:hypothetical protein
MRRVERLKAGGIVFHEGFLVHAGRDQHRIMTTAQFLQRRILADRKALVKDDGPDRRRISARLGL